MVLQDMGPDGDFPQLCLHLPLRAQCQSCWHDEANPLSLSKVGEMPSNSTQIFLHQTLHGGAGEAAM